jgi:hypothetical protein
MPFLGGGGGVSGATSLILQAYKSLIAPLKNAPSAMDVSYNPGSATTYPINNILFGRNITIGVNATLRFSSQYTNMIICDTLQLDGKIDITGVVSNSASNGGSGAGNITIIARQINGAGTIQAYGGNGTASSSTSNSNGANGTFLSSTTGFAGFGSSSAAGAGGGNAFSAYNYAPAILSLAWLNNFPQFTAVAPVGNTASESIAPGNYAMYAGPGGGNLNGSSTAAYGGGGGGNALVQGGAGGGSGGTTGVYSGGGGGGAGYVFIVSENAIPAITINAYGGNGGAGFSAGSGGGGAGGVIVQYTPSSSAIVNNSGGTSPVGTGNPLGGTGTSGNTGINAVLPLAS